MKNELLQQWQKDVDDYGDNAYLMYEYYDNKSSSPIKNNQAVDRLFYLEWFDKFKRKQSAELPFDLERAKCGDDNEISTKGKEMKASPLVQAFLALTDAIELEEQPTNVFEIKNHDDFSYVWPDLLKEPFNNCGDRSQWKYTKNRHNFNKGRK